MHGSDKASPAVPVPGPVEGRRSWRAIFIALRVDPFMRLGLVLSLVLVLTFPSLSAQDTTILPEPSEFPPCDVPEPVRFATLGVMLENLEFDGNGSLFVTAFDDGLYRLHPNGTFAHAAASPRARPDGESSDLAITTAYMGIVRGVDGALYVAEGHTLTTPIEGRILRYPVPGGAEVTAFATGFPNTNGLAADRDGNLYLAHGFDEELWKVTPDGSWSVWTRVPDTVNGVDLHPDGERLVIAPLGDPSNTVFAIPLDDPDAREPLFRFNAPPAMATMQGPMADRPLWTKGIDDLTVAPDGRVLVTAHMRSQFVMGDPKTEEACILLDGTRAEPSSIRVAHGFGEWDGWVFTTDFSGDVWAIDIRIGDPVVNSTEEGSEEKEETEGTPAGSFAVGVLSVLGVVAVSRRRERMR